MRKRTWYTAVTFGPHPRHGGQTYGGAVLEGTCLQGTCLQGAYLD
jgi:hypothetical protein